MKNLRTILACVSIALLSLNASSQVNKSPIKEPDQNKPLLFAGMPDRIPVSMDYINSLFGSTAGRAVSLSTPDNITGSRFEGNVISTGSELNNRIQSVVIRSTNFLGANFTVSKTISEQGVVSYTGRIISFQHGDAYELKNESGNLVLVKKKFYSLVND